MRRGSEFCTWPAALALATLSFASACSSIRVPFLSSQPTVEEKIELVAVMPADLSGPPAGQVGGTVEKEGPLVVTAAIYGALSSTYKWRFVPDLTVADAMDNVSPLDSDERRAQTLGKAVSAEGVIFASVWRYEERVGTPRDAESPATVGFTLRLVSTASGEVVWEDSYEAKQETLGATMFDWALFWEDPPHWLTAEEMTQAGVDHLMDSLQRTLD